MKKIILALFLILVSLNSIFAGGEKEDNTYVFAANCEWPPLEYVDEEGNIVGFEIDLLKAIGEVTGVEIEVRNVAWDGIFAGLSNGQYDGVASGVSVTEDRKKTMAFSDTILTITQSILSPIGHKEYTSENEIKDKTVGVQLGTTGHFACEASGIENIKAYDSIPLAVEDLLNGNLDVVVCDSIVASDFVLANENYKGKLEITGKINNAEAEDIALCLKKDNAKLLEILNNGLKILTENGKVEELKAKYNMI